MAAYREVFGEREGELRVMARAGMSSSKARGGTAQNLIRNLSDGCL